MPGLLCTTLEIEKKADRWWATTSSAQAKAASIPYASALRRLLEGEHTSYVVEMEDPI